MTIETFPGEIGDEYGSITAVYQGGTPDMRYVVVPGEPIPKPRQTRRDKWARRPCVIRYREWADRIREAAGPIQGEPWGIAARAYFPIPASYSKKKRAELQGRYHRVKPDADNVLKGLSDALTRQDQAVSFMMIWKFWEDYQGPRTEFYLFGDSPKREENSHDQETGKR